MTQEQHDIIMVATRTEKLEKQMGVLTENLVTLTESVRVTNSAITVFHDTQKMMSQKIVEHETSLGEIKNASNKFKGGWWLATAVCSFIGGAITITGILMALLHNIKGGL